MGSIWFDFLDMSTKPLRGAYPNLRMVTPWSNPGPVISNTYCAYCLIRVFSRSKLLLSNSLTLFPGFFGFLCYSPLKILQTHLVQLYIGDH